MSWCITGLAAGLPIEWAERRPLFPATFHSCSGSPRAARLAGPAHSAGSYPPGQIHCSGSYRTAVHWTSRCSLAKHIPPPESPTAVHQYLREKQKRTSVCLKCFSLTVIHCGRVRVAACIFIIIKYKIHCEFKGFNLKHVWLLIWSRGHSGVRKFKSADIECNEI